VKTASNHGPRTRRFEFSAGKSNKFWEVAIAGTGVTVCFGRIGTQGQSQAKSFPDEAAAEKHADKLIQEKLGKGYREMTSP
jgi:predicted DNA-binding WGR domain protein